MRKRCLLGWMLMNRVAVTAFADLEGAEEAQDAGADEAGENSGAVAEVVGDYVNTNAFIEALYNSLTGTKASSCGTTTRVCASATKVAQRCAQTVVMT